MIDYLLIITRSESFCKAKCEGFYQFATQPQRVREYCPYNLYSPEKPGQPPRFLIQEELFSVEVRGGKIRLPSLIIDNKEVYYGAHSKGS